jgi:translation initiation factor IF-2
MTRRWRSSRTAVPGLHPGPTRRGLPPPGDPGRGDRDAGNPHPHPCRPPAGGRTGHRAGLGLSRGRLGGAAGRADRGRVPRVRGRDGTLVLPDGKPGPARAQDAVPAGSGVTDFEVTPARWPGRHGPGPRRAGLVPGFLHARRIVSSRHRPWPGRRWRARPDPTLDGAARSAAGAGCGNARTPPATLPGRPGGRRRGRRAGRGRRRRRHRGAGGGRRDAPPTAPFQPGPGRPGPAPGGRGLGSGPAGTNGNQRHIGRRGPGSGPFHYVWRNGTELELTGERDGIYRVRLTRDLSRVVAGQTRWTLARRHAAARPPGWPPCGWTRSRAGSTSGSP